jgi:small subunit ribosomal protein S17
MERSKRKFYIGIVVSDKTNKTRQVSVERSFRHVLYDTVIRNKRNFAVHDAGNISKLGDYVKIMESRPISKTKKWILVGIKNKG